MGGIGEYATGRYAGRGPKNYRRSDARIMDDVCERLTRHPDIDASDVEVDVKDCIVTLRGHVDSRRTRRLAEEIIDDIPGVTDVKNEITVQQPKAGITEEIPTSP
jgi:osmotically-inducible protein OsmY